MDADWSDVEVELIVADYFSMLINELKGVPINKKAHRQRLRPLLRNRSDGSVEFKHQNISAVLVESGLPFIRGYKPRFNFQRSKLTSAVAEYIKSRRELIQIFETFSLAVEPNKPVDYLTWVVTPPCIGEKRQQTGSTTRRPFQTNYLEREQYNRILGLKGEELAISFEKKMLISVGKQALADKIEWISKDRGDGLGFDILSKNLNGSDKYIEVKTTKLSKESPFFFSANEYNFSIQQSKDFYLYRIFNFSTKPQIYTLNGSFDSFCNVEPASYIGSF